MSRAVYLLYSYRIAYLLGKIGHFIKFILWLESAACRETGVERGLTRVWFQLGKGVEVGGFFPKWDGSGSLCAGEERGAWMLVGSGSPSAAAQFLLDGGRAD